MRRMMLAAALAAMACNATAAQAETKEERQAREEEEKSLGSLYLRCDGQPNNMSDGESFARFLGAVTLLGILAPSPETPDPSKRLFGADGVDACSQLIDGDKAEGNGLRRIPLILARGLHQIEAKNYEAAIADVDKARTEAKEMGLAGNPYFERSMGLSFDRIEAGALNRMGEYAKAREVGLRNVEGIEFGFFPLIWSTPYSTFQDDLSPDEETYLAAIARFMPQQTNVYANRLEEVGRFADAAKRREDLIAFLDSLLKKEVHSAYYARAAISYALAGNWDSAEREGQFSANQLKRLRDEGRPEADASVVVELLDLLDVLRLVRDGNMKDARRNFAARSQWIEPSFGAICEVTRILREGADESELFGSLSKSPEQLLEERRENARAQLLETDTDNKTLFRNITSYAKISDFEGQSKRVWRTDKSKMQAQEPMEGTEFFVISPQGPAKVRGDATVLHAALMAKQQGKEGFVMMFMPSEGGLGAVRYVDRAEVGEDNRLFFDADAVIAELGEVIPSPEAIKARKQVAEDRN